MVRIWGNTLHHIYNKRRCSAASFVINVGCVAPRCGAPCTENDLTSSTGKACLREIEQAALARYTRRTCGDGTARG